MARKSVPNYVKIHDALKDEVEKGIWKLDNVFQANVIWPSVLLSVE